MATYQDLEYRDVNGNKTVFNKLTGQGYQTPTQLAGDLGIQSPQINWGAITAKDLTPATPITLPTVPDTSQDSQAILAGTKTEAQMIADQMAKRAAELKAEQDASKGDPLTEFLKSSGEAQDESGSAMDLYKSFYQSPEYTALETEKSTQKQLYNTAKNEFNMVQAKINAVNAQADAIPLQIQQEFQGRGATAGGAAPIQTARLREVAIQALALQPALYAAQAKMANAQGDYQAAQDNLTEATNRMDKYFTALLADRNDKLEYKNRLIDKVYDYSTKKEQAQLDAIKDKNNKDFEIQKLNMQRMKELANAAIENGQGSLATQIAQLDPSSPDFQTKLAQLQGQIQIKDETVNSLILKYPDAGILPTDSLAVASAKLKNSRIYQEQVYRAPSGGGLSTSIIEVGGKKLLINSKTGETIKELGAADTTLLSNDKLVKLQGAGFSQPDITNITNDINQYGINKVLEGITDPNQKKALQDVYSVQVEQTKEEIENDMKMLFTDDELKKIADDLGYSAWWRGAKGDIETMFKEASVEDLKRAITNNAK